MRGITAALILLWIALSVPHARAQEEAFVAPPAPEDQILDEARLFVRSPARKQAIVTALAELEEKHGFRLYVVLYNSLFGRSVLDRAQVLQEAWLGEQPGMVLVLETDSGLFKVGQAAPDQAEIEPGKSIPLAGPTDLLPADLTRLMRKLEGPLAEAADREEFTERLGVGMATGAAAIFDERVATPKGATKTRMIVLAVGLLAATGLVALIVVAGLKRAESKALERFVFPKIGVGMRLGAPYGGGKVSSRSFRGRAPER